jgi:hypothetical protein
LLAASLLDDRSNFLTVRFLIYGIPKPSALLRMPLTPVDSHEEISPWHSWIDRFAQREIIEATKHFAYFSSLRDNKELLEDEYWSKTPKDAEKEFQETELAEEMALQSVKAHAKLETSGVDEAFQPRGKLEIAVRRLTAHGRF